MSIDSVSAWGDAEVGRSEHTKVILEGPSRGRLDPGLIATLLPRRRIRGDVVARVEELHLRGTLALHPKECHAIAVSPARVRDAQRKGTELGMLHPSVRSKPHA